MTYNEWVQAQGKRHKTIIKKLLKQEFTKEQIIEYFDFENMKIKEMDFCPLYAENKKCHDMEKLNCYLCSCPYFRFKDDGIQKLEEKTQFSFCSIDAKDGKAGVYGDAIHHDCSGCTVPHSRAYVKKNFDLDWNQIMKECEVK